MQTKTLLELEPEQSFSPNLLCIVLTSLTHQVKIDSGTQMHFMYLKLTGTHLTIIYLKTD